MNAYLGLFLTFVRIGALMFGGGYAMLPLLQREVVENKKWATDEELLDCYAIGQCTPGVIAVNTATFIGYRQKGFWGAVIATLGIVSPSLVTITVIAALLGNFMEYQAVRYAFGGIRVCALVLIINAVIRLLRSAVKDAWTLLIFAAVFLAMVLTDVSPVFFVLAAGLLGCVIQGLKGARQ